jgi:hypothetical protein
MVCRSGIGVPARCHLLCCVELTDHLKNHRYIQGRDLVSNLPSRQPGITEAPDLRLSYIWRKLILGVLGKVLCDRVVSLNLPCESRVLPIIPGRES